MNRSTAWKAFERKAAELFGGIRSAFSGAQPAITGTRGDVRHEHLYIEAKHRHAHSLCSLMRDVRVKATAERKIPVICLHEHQQRGCLIVIDSNDLDQLARAGRYDDLPLFQKGNTMAANEQLIDDDTGSLFDESESFEDEGETATDDDDCGANWGCV